MTTHTVFALLTELEQAHAKHQGQRAAAMERYLEDDTMPEWLKAQLRATFAAAAEEEVQGILELRDLLSEEWDCRCACGREVTVTRAELESGYSTGCGGDDCDVLAALAAGDRL